MKALKKIHRPKPYLLEAAWDDGFTSTIKIESFRDACPCADCGEERKKPVTSFISLDGLKPGKYGLKSLTTVGNYAVTAVWNDGHDTGIYPYDFLREVFEKNALTEEQIEDIIKIKEKIKKN